MRPSAFRDLTLSEDARVENEGKGPNPNNDQIRVMIEHMVVTDSVKAMKEKDVERKCA